MGDAFSRVMPSWESCQELYNKGKDYAIAALSNADRVCKAFVSLVEQLFKQFGAAVPDWAQGLMAMLDNVPKPPLVDVQRKPAADPTQAAIMEQLAPMVQSAMDQAKGGKCKAMMDAFFARCKKQPPKE